MLAVVVDMDLPQVLVMEQMPVTYHGQKVVEVLGILSDLDLELQDQVVQVRVLDGLILRIQ
jgi:hypothetical protein